jgi:Ner family transcriptional regulator
MQITDSPKKPAFGEDWHPAEVVCALRLKGKTTLRRLSRQHHYHPGAAGRALRNAWPKMERLIAEAIGVTPQTIWPSRYNADGSPRSGRGERALRNPKRSTAGAHGVNAAHRSSPAPKA